MDDQARAYSTTLVENALQGVRDGVTLAVVDYAVWDEAYYWVVERDDASVDANLGSGATDSGTFDTLYILNPDGVPLYAYETDGDGSDLSIFDPSAAAPLVEALRAQPDAPDAEVGAVTRVNGRVAFAWATRIQEYEVDPAQTPELPILVGMQWLTEEMVSAIAVRLLISDMYLYGPALPVPDGWTSFSVEDNSGRALAVVAWEAPRPGPEFLNSLAPLLAGVSLFLVVSTILVSTLSFRQSAAYNDERSRARRDKLTRLLNRSGLEEEARKSTVVAALRSGSAAVLYFDLNGFKQLNDKAGHAAGDKALQIFSGRLRGIVRNTDILARIGGDEFVCLVLDDAPVEAACELAQRIRQENAAPVQLGLHSLVMEPAIGIAIAEGGADLTTLITRADQAMYTAKKQGTNAPIIFGEATLSADPAQATMPHEMEVKAS